MMISPPPPSQFPPFPPPLLPSSPSPNPFAHLPDFVHSASAASYTPFSVNLDGITGSLKKYSTR